MAIQEVKLIIAGSRTVDKYRAFFELGKWLKPQEQFDIIFVTGCCKSGPDQVPFLLQETDWGISIKKFPADWDLHGKAAGPIRNRQMAKYADCLLLIWDGKSRGSMNMKQEMERIGKPVYEVIIND